MKLAFVFTILGSLFLVLSNGFCNVDSKAEEDGKDKCLRFDLLSHLSKSDLPVCPITRPPVLFGPQLSSFYEDYQPQKISNATNTTNITGSALDDAAVAALDDRTKHQLEADLNRLLAQENRTYNESSDGAKQNDTQPHDHPAIPQDTDPPLPSFNEWTKQKLEEQHQQQQTKQADKNGAGNISVAGSGQTTVTGDGTSKTVMVEQRHARNYASKECGAKIMLANPQAQHASSVLNEKEPDEYMLNPCNAEQKFFVVELCETIQITRLDLANFELFSSSPKDFRVFVAERYPTTEWTLLGTWTAEDQRKVQNFPVELRIYAKYVKVELLSHYGTEHFCPVSLIRVLGVSLVEEYEAEAAQEQRQQTQQQQPLPQTNGDPVTPAPIEIVDKIDDNQASCDELDIIVNEISRRTPADGARSSDSESVQSTNFISRQQLLVNAKDAVVHLAKGVIDKAQAVFFVAKPSSANETATNSTSNATMISDQVLTPICEIATFQISEHWRQCLLCDVQGNVSRKLCGYVRAFLVKRRPRRPMVAFAANTVNILANQGVTQESTKTGDVVTGLEQLFGSVEKPAFDQALDMVQNDNEKYQTTPMPVAPTTAPVVVNQQAVPVDASSLPGVASNAKESIFARLNNRIRMLENNISLSGEYLGELSLRYRKQMEDMQRALNNSTFLISQHKKATEQRLAQYRSEIESLNVELEKLKRMMSEQRDRQQQNEYLMGNETRTLRLESALSSAQAWAPLIALLEIAVIISVLIYCCRGNSAVDERALEAIVERRVRIAIAEELRKLTKNGSVANGIISNMANGHLLPETENDRNAQVYDVTYQRSNNTDARSLRLQSEPIPQYDRPHSSVASSSNSLVESMSLLPHSVSGDKARKKKRQKLRRRNLSPPRKSSDQMVNISSRNDRRDDDIALNDSAAGILFSTSSGSKAVWQHVLPSFRKSALPVRQCQNQERRGSSGSIITGTFNAWTKRKYFSQNAFEILASSSRDNGHNEPLEKKPRSGRGPS